MDPKHRKDSTIPPVPRERSLLSQIYLSAGLAMFVFVFLWTVSAVFWLSTEAVQGLDVEADQQAGELSLALAPILWRLDEKSIQALLDTKAQNPEFTFITVKDTSMGLVWSSPERPRLRTSWQVERRSPVVYNGKTIAELTLILNLQPRSEQTSRTIVALVASQVLLFGALLASIAVAWQNVRRRLRQMVAVVEHFSTNEERSRMEPGANDEFGKLALGFNTMADQLQVYHRSMENEIRDRTERLMESEKLALVGSLVAGVAHEINTPVGNGITITSWLVGRTREARALWAAGAEPKADLGSFFTDLTASLEILQGGLDRTSFLIQSFKKIGADQVVDDRRKLNLGQTVQDVAASLEPTLKSTRIRLVLDEEAPVVTDNHPGALFQILSNLILNAQAHGYPQGGQGTVTVSWGPGDAEDRFWLSVADDGVGMPPEVLSQVFEPFFTTNRKGGGTGLGLCIVQNLVQNLGGTISVESEPGKGTRFRIVLPTRAPDQVSLAQAMDATGRWRA